jgi:wyosine [tRNA(Phe)-imidazoG37] synthetase (radical SAM superfamily)
LIVLFHETNVVTLSYVNKQKQYIMTVIYPSPIFGPIHSRRLGISLGINLMPGDGKVCTFDCIYCECGFNADHRPSSPRPTREEVRKALENKLKEMQETGIKPDVLTFAGNGEPTAHPHFPEIIDDTISLRNKYFPDAKVSILSNSTFIDRPAVVDALMKVDNNILKLDTISTKYIQTVNRPTGNYSVDNIIKNMKAFNGHCIIQTMFMKGSYNGIDVNNTSDEYVLPWLKAVKEIAPSMVMIYTIDRETPDHDLLKATHEELDRIVSMIKNEGIDATASY